MCKVMAIAGVKPNKTKELTKWVRAAAEIMSENDRDGLGYAAVNKDGLFGERWVNPKHAFVHRSGGYTPTEAHFAHILSDVSGSALGYNKFGNVPGKGGNKGLFEGTQAIILHTRAATNGSVSIRNTHPFVSGGNTALIHNGVIGNQHKLTNLTSDCDSECIVNLYAEHGVSINPREIQKVATALSGWYACAVLTQDADGHYVMDIFKDGSTSLVWSYIQELGTVVFCTTDSIIRKICKRLGYRVGVIHSVLPERFVRLDVVNGEPMMGHIPFKTFQYSTVTYGGYRSTGAHGWATEYEDDTDDTLMPGAGADDAEWEEYIKTKEGEAELQRLVREVEEELAMENKDRIKLVGWNELRNEHVADDGSDVDDEDAVDKLIAANMLLNKGGK